jgi:hypothetical protein
MDPPWTVERGRPQVRKAGVEVFGSIFPSVGSLVSWGVSWGVSVKKRRGLRS